MPRVVEAVQAHGREEHGENLGEAEVRAAAQPVGEAP